MKFLFILSLSVIPLALYLHGEPLSLVWQAWALFTLAVLWFVLRPSPNRVNSEKPGEIRSEVEQIGST